MTTFKDNTGRTWSMTLDIHAVDRVKTLAGVDLLSTLSGSLIQRLIDEPVTLCNAIYAVCKPEADALKITDTDFGALMTGDGIDSATAALLDELVRFLPKDRRKGAIRALKKVAKRIDKQRTAGRIS